MCFEICRICISKICDCNIAKKDKWKATFKKCYRGGSLGGTVVWRLPLAQGAILETRDRVPRQAPGAWSLLLPLPVSLPLYLFEYHKKNF